MAKRNYNRRDSGLLVADDSLIVPRAGDGIPRPWWSSPYIPLAAKAVNQIQFMDGHILFGDSSGNNTDKIAFHEDCCCGDCDYCSGETPSEFLVTIPALSNLACSECASLAGDYTVTRVADVLPCCEWSYVFDDGPCCTGELVFHVCYLPTTFFVQVIFRSRDASNPLFMHIWYKSYGSTPLNCSAFTNESIPFLTQQASNDRCDGSLVARKCDAIGTAATVTAL